MADDEQKRKALGKLYGATTAIMPDSPFTVEKILLSTAKAKSWAGPANSGYWQEKTANCVNSFL